MEAESKPKKKEGKKKGEEKYVFILYNHTIAEIQVFLVRYLQERGLGGLLLTYDLLDVNHRKIPKQTNKQTIIVSASNTTIKGISRN